MYAIAIDSGGTKIVGSVVDDNGNIVEKERHPNGGHSGDFLVETYCSIIEQYKKKYDISVVGIGCNGRIDVKQGIVKDCSQYTNYENRNIRKEIEGFSGLPISVNNDCYVGIYGEIWKGAAHGYNSVVGLMLGTGIGGGIYEDGHFLHGGHFGAGEIGHMILHRNGFPCYCGQSGCVERYVSGTALWKLYNERTGSGRISSGYEFFELYHAGDADAAAVLGQFVDDLSLVMVNIANFADPGVFLIGGGLADTKADWADNLTERYRHLAGPYLRNTPVVFAQMGNDAALLGAAKFGFDYIEKLQK